MNTLYCEKDHKEETVQFERHLLDFDTLQIKQCQPPKAVKLSTICFAHLQLFQKNFTNPNQTKENIELILELI